MTTKPDAKFDALRGQGFTGSVSDMTLQWLISNGATSSQLSDAWDEMLESKGFGPANPDGWYDLLGSLGYTGSISVRSRDFWLAGGTLS